MSITVMAATPIFYWLIREGRIRLTLLAAVLKTAGRKAMQVRLLSPPPFLFNHLPLISSTLLRRTKAK